MATNRNLFPPNRSPKMRESQQLSFGLWIVRRIFEENQQTAIQTKIYRAALWGIFSSNKSD
jgi:hypothetical protein